jgi:hypothetical protein
LHTTTGNAIVDFQRRFGSTRFEWLRTAPTKREVPMSFRAAISPLFPVYTGQIIPNVIPLQQYVLQRENAFPVARGAVK